jgi:N-terminal domain of galactosyltransferase
VPSDQHPVPGSQRPAPGTEEPGTDARRPAPFAPPRSGAAAVAARLADHVVLSTSPEVPLIAADYWELSVRAYLSMHSLVRDLVAGQRPAEARYQALVAAPDDFRAHRALTAALAELLDQQPGECAAVAARVARADEQIWIDYWLGPSFTGGEPEYRLDQVAVAPAGRPPGSPSGPGRAEVNVIIPFRDAGRGGRTRNLLACLRALRDQDFPAPAVRVTVVETDVEPRVRELAGPLADRYLHAYKDGLFNKSWAVNLGLRDGGAPGAAPTPELTCVLDADVLVERSFLAVNTARFRLGHDAHLAYRDILSLDAASSDRAIRIRLDDGAAQPDPAALRGLRLRETPGGCLWARTEALHRIGGFDERYEGWGGEDDDVTGRLAREGTLIRFDDTLLHLHHPRPQMVGADGQFLNGHLTDSHLRPDAWTGADGYGEPGRFWPEAAEGSRA